MGRRTYIGVLVALLSVLVALRQTVLAPAPAPNPAVQGRNNTVLFLFGNAHGLSNVHVATVFSLLKHHPEVDVHVGSFPASQTRVDRVSAAAGRDARFWTLQGLDYIQVMQQNGATPLTMVQPPGRVGIDDMSSKMAEYMSPWSADAHFDLYAQMRQVIDDIDPAVVVLDYLFSPAVNAAREAGRLHAVISPNVLADNFAGEQPALQVFWKYPMIGSGFDFPVPWRDIPENIYLAFKFIKGVVHMPEIEAKLQVLRSKGLKNPLTFSNMRRNDSPWISQELEGAALPLSVMPANVTRVGPIAISVATAEQQDPALAAWLARRPTVLVNLGSGMRFTETQARVMAAALADVLGRTEIQVLWKFRTWPEAGFEDGDAFRAPLEKYITDGRVKIESWLAVDPTAILETGHVVASVHHGGGNVYHEAILSGVPQLALPLWIDLYNYAVLIERIGVGLWGSRKTAPEWTVEELSAALLKLVDGGPASLAMREKAKLLGEKARVRQGRDHAADIVAELAASGR